MTKIRTFESDPHYDDERYDDCKNDNRKTQEQLDQEEDGAMIADAERGQ